MLEILKKAGVATGVATFLVLAITFVPLYWQYQTNIELKSRISKLEAQVTATGKVDK